MQAQAVAEAVRRALGDEPCTSGELKVRVTASIGVHVIEPQSGTGVDEALRIADRALYVAKANGRDCVELSAPGV